MPYVYSLFSIQANRRGVRTHHRCTYNNNSNERKRPELEPIFHFSDHAQVSALFQIAVATEPPKFPQGFSDGVCMNSAKD